MSQTYSAQEARSWLENNLPDWTVEKEELSRTYRTGNWRLTLMVANAIGFLAEAADHHPELILNYPNVVIHLSTHDLGGISDKDFELARRIEETVTWLPAAGDSLRGVDPRKWLG